MRRVAILALVGIFAAAPAAFGAEHRTGYHQSESDYEARRRLVKKDYAVAMMEANRALKANPQDPLALTTRGQAYFDLGDYPHAIADHDAVLVIAPDDPDALTNACWDRAVANTDLGRAKTYCDMAVGRSGRVAPYDARGFLHLRRGEYDAALTDYEAASKDPREPGPLYGRGIAKIRLGRIEEGRADIAEAIKLKADIAGSYERWGMRP